MHEQLQTIYGYLTQFGINFLAALLIFFIGKWAAQILSQLFEKFLLNTKVEKTLAIFGKNIAYFTMLTFVAIAALNKMGVETNSFLAIIGAAGLAVGLALQGSLSNFAAGFMMVIFHPFSLDDYIEAGGAEGTVTEIQIFNTIIMTKDNKRVIVPNAKITGDADHRLSAQLIMKLQIAITSMICMIVAVGMGRFALTPQLPHMIAEHQITLTQASLLAAANFLGYLLGAIETISAKRHLILRLKCGLWGSAIILALSSLVPFNAAGIYVNLLLRFAAGIASAWTFVLISTWIQQQLAKEHALRTVAFCGPGAGIILTGILAVGLDYWHTSAAFNWFIFGVVALIASFAIHKNLPDSLPDVSTEIRFPMTGDSRRLLISYALCGLGYILPATFLSKLAVDQFPGSLIADAFWPLFGFAIITGMTLLAIQKNIKDPQRLLAGIFCLQGMGVLACTLLHGIVGLLIGTLLVGGSFMVILQLTMHLGSQLAPKHLRAMTGVLTTGFAVGQLIGPLLSALSTHLYSSMTPALLAAAIGSFIGTLLVYSIRTPSMI